MTSSAADDSAAAAIARSAAFATSATSAASDASDDELLRRQDARQAESAKVIADLGLDVRLAVLGEPVRTGSSVFGLMVRRDVDITVACPVLDEQTLTAVAGLGAELARHPRVRQVTYRDDTGHWNVEPDAFPDGVYLKVDYRMVGGEDWTFDLWFVDRPEQQPDLADLKTMPGRLAHGSRVAILRIKEAWDARPEYGRTVRSVDVYSAVLDHGITTPEAFEEWLAAGAGTVATTGMG